jgi:hypothetical protein
MIDKDLVFVGERGKNVAFHGDIEKMSKDDAIKAYVLVTRISNAIAQRQKELRMRVDGLLLKEKPIVENVTMDSDDWSITRTNRNKDKSAPSVAKVCSLLKAKGRDEGLVFIQPPQPPPEFSPAKFRALLELGLITQEEYDSCLEPLDPATTVTVNLPKVLDNQLFNAVLGTAIKEQPVLLVEAKPAAKKAKKK